MNYHPLIPIIISILIPGIWLLNRSILIAYEKDFLKKVRTWLGERPILVPAISVFIVPIFLSCLISNQIPDIVKFFIPLATFMAGQFISRQDQKRAVEREQVKLLLVIERKISIIKIKISYNENILNRELAEISKGSFSEIRLEPLDRITEDFTNLYLFLLPKNEILLTIDEAFDIWEAIRFIDRFNNLLEDRQNFRTKCRELSENSDGKYLIFLKYLTFLRTVDQNLLKTIESIKEHIEKIDTTKAIDRMNNLIN